VVKKDVPEPQGKKQNKKGAEKSVEVAKPSDKPVEEESDREDEFKKGDKEKFKKTTKVGVKKKKTGKAPKGFEEGTMGMMALAMFAKSTKLPHLSIY